MGNRRCRTGRRLAAGASLGLAVCLVVVGGCSGGQSSSDHTSGTDGSKRLSTVSSTSSGPSTAPGGASTSVAPVDASGSSGSSTPSWAVELDHITSHKLPLDAYGDVLGGEFSQALDLLTGTCMSKKGFTYAPVASTSLSSSPATVYIDDVGYLGLPPSGAGPDDHMINPDTPTTSVPPGYWKALVGIDDPSQGVQPNSGGCDPEAYAQLVGSGGAPDKDQLTSQLAGQAMSTTLASSAYRSSVERWRDCVHDAGLSLREPADEIKTSDPGFEASVECKLSSGLAKAFIDGLVSAQTHLVDANFQALDEMQRRGEAADARAKAVIEANR